MDPTKQLGKWFSEVSEETCPGQSFSLEIDHILERKQSTYQDILVFQSKTYGRVLVLDGMIQVTERDEFAYQEMLTHLPMFSHPDPKKVLIVGGGDGGILREVLKHPSVEKVVQCEIDEAVIELSKKYLPSLSSGYSDPRLDLHIGDGLKFLESCPNSFDVIVTDSSDPVGPGEALFQSTYFELLKKALRSGGLLSSQGENIWLHLNLIKSMIHSCQEVFPVVEYANISIPSYPSGQIGAILCSTNPETDFRRPLRKLIEAELDAWKLRYYSPEVHAAACVLPRFAKELFQKH